MDNLLDTTSVSNITSLNTKANITKIYHIADIHIYKNNNRDVEYIEVFNNLYDQIKQDTENALIVCCGDIFHDGTSPSSTLLVKDLFSKLNELCDIIIIIGNHDQPNKSNSETINFVYSTLYKLEKNKLNKKNKIHLLPKSGTYLYGNIAFGYTDMYATSVYQIPTNITNKKKIALWHGTLNKIKLNTNYESDGIFNISSFDGYDYVLLGDIHQHIFLTENIAYCGSLIQQNFGESIDNHGYIKWNLLTNTNEHIHIKNNYGFLTIKAKNNQIEKYDTKIVPQNINLRIIYENCDINFINDIHTKIAQKHTILDFYQQEKKETNITHQNKDMLCEIINDTTTINTIITYMKKQTVQHSDEYYTKVTTILQQLLQNNIKYAYDGNIKNMTLKSLCFNNFNLYGKDNYIDFENLNGIVNISGNNGIGKSSLIHCMLFAIYGLCEQSVSKFEYINMNEQSMQTLIVFDINNIEYKINRRIYSKDLNKSGKHLEQQVILYENGIDISAEKYECNK